MLTVVRRKRINVIHYDGYPTIRKRIASVGFMELVVGDLSGERMDTFLHSFYKVLLARDSIT